MAKLPQISVPIILITLQSDPALGKFPLIYLIRHRCVEMKNTFGHKQAHYRRPTTKHSLSSLHTKEKNITKIQQQQHLRVTAKKHTITSVL